MNILLPAAEFSPLVRVGGLAEAVSGLAKMLNKLGASVTPVIPEYWPIDLIESREIPLDVPVWCGEVSARIGKVSGVGRIVLVRSSLFLGGHPYIDPETGESWADSDLRFMVFSAAVAALADELEPDLVHLNDWHTAAAVGFMRSSIPTVLTIHTLGYQGVCSESWLDNIPNHAERFSWFGTTNPLAGGIRSVDRVVAVSPNYAAEIVTEAGGMGLHSELAELGERLVGIRNGIDTDVWNPETDPLLLANYDEPRAEEAKKAEKRHLLDLAGWPDDGTPLLGVVSRLVDQKGIDIVLDLAPYLATMPARIFLLGSGLPRITQDVRALADSMPDRVWAVTDRFDEPLAHHIFAGSDLFLMPSRFEPCGLAQMQSMAYGTPTVATPVGGLVDTIVDLDRDRANGQGFLAATVDSAGFLDATHRAVRGVRTASSRRAMRRRAMVTDWSWLGPARAHLRLYEELSD